jgi:prepilin-type N-terminal cleavage/methylation domain-containing protein
MRGMTLAEMLVVIAVTGVVAGLLLSTISSFYKGNAYVLESAVSVDNARRGVALTLENVREASYGDNGGYPVVAAATSSLTFHSDADTDDGIERVRIFIQDGVLYRVVTDASGNPPTYSGGSSATSTIIGYVRNGTSTPLFRYYDESGTELSTTSPDISQIASVFTTLMIDINPTRAPNILTFTGSATIRNLLGL